MRHIGLFALVVLLIVLVVVSPGCASTAGPMATEADFYGFITEIHPNGEGDTPGQISVESHADKIVSKYVVAITNETLIFWQDGANLRQTDFEALENKQWVKIWFTGPVLESYPMQGTARQVAIER